MKPVLVLLNIKIIIDLITTSKLVEKAVSIANDVYEPHLLTTVAWWNVDHDYVNEFLLKYLGTVTTIRIKQCYEGRTKILKSQQAVVFATKPEEFDNFLTLTNNVTFEATLVILIIVNENPSIDLTPYTKIALQRDVEDIAVVGLKFDGTVAVFSIIPYRSGVCGDYTPREITTPQSNMFKEKKYGNFHGCPIRVTAFELMPYVQLIKENNIVVALNGIDAKFVNFVFRTLNATMKIVKASDHGEPGEYKNGKPEGLFGDLFYDRSEIVLPSLIINSKRYPANLSPIYRPTHIVICLWNRAEIHKFARIFLPFCSWTTSIIIAGAILVYATLRFFRRFGRIDYELPQRMQLGIFSVTIGQVYNFNSRHWLVNFLIMFWVWFCFVYRLFYTGTLIVQHVLLEPQIKDFTMANEIAKEVYIYRPIIEFYRNTSLEEKAVTVTVTEMKNLLFAIASGEKILLATEIGIVNFYTKNVQILENLMINAPSCLLYIEDVGPRWPASKYISNIILRSVDTGHINKIMRHFKAQNLNETDEFSYKPLGMKTLGFCFIGLMLMYVVCFIILGAEIFYKFYVTRRNSVHIPFLN